ncbi:MAG: amino acid permease [Chitinispirillia bacterium]|nr:amino acid permease [Chitinispirillia bacterium]MCL2267641.1 amino acid permease [Chitinispirillia bacterium]
MKTGPFSETEQQPGDPSGQNGATGGDGFTSSSPPEIKKFSTFDGVFAPTILTILGVVMFMRAGFVVGHAGIYGALAILVMAKTITTLTGLSISAIATNAEVKGGGTYYLISRSLGPEFGGAIAITIFLAQTLSIPFYLIGFTEAVVHTFPALDIYFDLIAYGVFAFIALFSLKGAGIVMKIQFFIMGILILSIASFLIGAGLKFDPATFAANTAPLEGSPFPFWVLFAIYFPAVTGILSGVNMSGDLKNPTRSIPFGALAAILTGFAIYAAQIILWGGASSREELTGDSYKTLTGLWPYFTTVLVVAGMFAASLSNILATILGSPRVLQALAQDKLLKPVNFFAKMTENGEPRRAMILTIGIAVTVLYIACRGGSGGGSLNVMARVVSMFFLWTYGIINLAAFVESFSRNPSFRPRFKFFHWSAALVGALACFAVTFIIDFKAAFFAGIVLAGLFFYVRKYVMSASFGDARRGFIYSRTRNNLITLSSLPVHEKNWRPTVVAFIGDPERRQPVMKYADWLSSGRGIMTVASLIKGEFAEMKAMRAAYLDMFHKILSQTRIKAFPEVIITPDYNTGVTHFLQANSIGPIKPNLAIFGWSSNLSRAQSFIDGLRTAASLNMSIGLICRPEMPDSKDAKERRNRKIDIWWRGERNGSLMVILAYLMSLNPEWSGVRIRILRIVNTTDDAESARKELEKLIEAARIDVEIKTIISDDSFPNMLRRQSGLSSVIFLGFSVDENTDPVKFQEAYTGLLQGMPTTILIQSTGEANLLS